jgi:hypothetical protein
MLTVLGTRLTGIPHKAPSLTHATPFQVASRVGEYSRVVGESSRAVSLTLDLYQSYSIAAIDLAY